MKEMDDVIDVVKEAEKMNAANKEESKKDPEEVKDEKKDSDKQPEKEVKADNKEADKKPEKETKDEKKEADKKPEKEAKAEEKDSEKNPDVSNKALTKEQKERLRNCAWKYRWRIVDCVYCGICLFFGTLLFRRDDQWYCSIRYECSDCPKYTGSVLFELCINVGND